MRGAREGRPAARRAQRRARRLPRRSGGVRPLPTGGCVLRRVPAPALNTEERELLPLLLGALDDADWAEIDAAFADNEGPLFGPARKAEFDAPFREIVDNAPAPMGFGDGKAEAG
ncbi:MAG: hypothetical protein V3R88_12350 [Alphaproteobacteria bacterium]